MNHEPKTAALLAYARGALSEQGRRRLEAHLTDCLSCRARLAAVHTAEGVIADLRELGGADVPELSEARAERMVNAILSAPTHAPKLFALLALHDDVLSEEGTRRIREHMAICGICEEAYEAMAAYERVSGEIRDLLPPESPEELPPEALATIRPIGLGNRNVRWVGAALIAVAAALLLWWRTPDATTAGVTRPEVRPPANTSGIDLEPEGLTATVARITGVIGDTPRCNDAPVHPGQLLELGAVCVTGAGDALHVAFDERTGFALSAGSGIEIHQAGEQGILLELGWGEISSTVEHGRAYAVEAQGRRFEVRGTRFAVRHTVDGPSAARVVEGAVAVMASQTGDRAGAGAAMVAMLRPMGETAADWSSDDSSSPPTVKDVHLNTGGDELHLAPSEWTRLGVDGLHISAGRGLGRIRMLLPAAGGPLHFSDAYGNHATLQRPASGSAAPVRAPVHAVRGSIPGPALRAAMPTFERDIRGCVNRALRMQPSAAGTAQLQLVVAADGHVVTANVLGAGAPVPLRTCLSAKARRWRMPAPVGGPRARISLPVAF